MECFTSPCANLSVGVANQFLTNLFNYLSIAQCSLSSPEMWPPDYGEIAMRRGFGEYDFIVVGAGSAGSVVANRLSENPNTKVLVLEAGGDPPIESAIPALLGTLANTKYDWQFNIEPSAKSGIYTNRWVRGKMLGGCSSLNAMAYVRGSEEDYNNWEALGNPTWGWENVLAYFKKSESNQDPEIADAFGGYYHSKNGLLSVELYKDNLSISHDIIRAAKEMNFSFVKDINADKKVAYTLVQGTLRSGLRDSTATAFLIPAMNRPNLHIVKHAHVLDLDISESGVVSGVRLILQGEKEFKVSAKKEVILSAGTINSPQILMLSGIGPQAHLQEMEIPMIQNLQVGKNLHDHPCIPLFIKLDPTTSISPSTGDLLQSFFVYLVQHTGALATIGSADTLGFVNVQDPLAQIPDFIFFHVAYLKGQTDDFYSFLQIFGYVDEFNRLITPAILESNILLILVGLLTEKSRGEILLRSREPTEKPKIFPNYLAESSDVVAFIKAIRLYQKFLQTEAFRSHEASLLVIPIPACDVLEYDSDEYWECYCRYTTATLFHPVGTNQMGPDSDPDAVVDYRLRVKGTTGLRVIDASIMPVVPRANTNAPTIMIGEKGTDFIKEDWGLSL